MLSKHCYSFINCSSITSNFCITANVPGFQTNLFNLSFSPKQIFLHAALSPTYHVLKLENVLQAHITLGQFGIFRFHFATLRL